MAANAPRKPLIEFLEAREFFHVQSTLKGHETYAKADERTGCPWTGIPYLIQVRFPRMTNFALDSEPFHGDFVELAKYLGQQPRELCFEIWPNLRR